MKKSSSSLKKRSLDISLQHKNEASYEFSKKKLLHLADFRVGAERVKAPIHVTIIIQSLEYQVNLCIIGSLPRQKWSTSVSIDSVVCRNRS